MRREAGHQHAPVGLGEDAVERLADLALGAGAALALDVGRVGEQGEHALLAELRQLVDVGHAAVDRRVVELVVAGVHDAALGRLDDDRQGVGHAVAHGAEAHGERREVEHRVLGHLVQLDHLEQTVLVELRLGEGQREAAAVDRHVDVAQDVGEGAEVVLVAVGDEEGEHVVAALAQVR